MMEPFPIRRRWNADIRLGMGGYEEYVAAAQQPGEASDDVRMPHEDEDGCVRITEPEDKPEEGVWSRTPLYEELQRVQTHEFENELKHPHTPFGVDLSAYLLAPTTEAFKERLRHHETLFRKAGIPARHLRFLPDLWCSERLPWEYTKQGWYGSVSNHKYQELVRERKFDRYGHGWFVPMESRRKRSDFEIALAAQLQPSAEERKMFGMEDHYGLSEYEMEAGEKTKFRTADEDVGFESRLYGPPGLAEPLLVSNSLGNHRFHSYQGDWRKGAMHGAGTYRFADDSEYAGGWSKGRRHGKGVTKYKDGTTYDGQWEGGYFHGYGEITYSNGTTYKGMWVKGMRHGKGTMHWERSGQTFTGMFYAGLRHGHGTQSSPKTGVAFEGEFEKGRIKGNGSLLLTDKKTKKVTRIRRGLWHKSEFAPGSGLVNMKDLVHVVDRERSKQTREKSTDYVAVHGTVLAAQLNDWCHSLKQGLRDERKQKKLDEEIAKREKLIEQKKQMAELREKAKKDKEAAQNDSDFDGEDEDEEEDAEGEEGGKGGQKDDSD
eukprot:CAMPEP_0172595754 /NCGR_PEP_ID=MMETSP1068-20121228/15387_1 /TAXON_ID=35684 /ORGANISM="Pseudopedinella elastica, Strain CCMP716" /LENGTH=545 /DNA_ID=CAMNT_0013394425 /DNA_START=189 /DNA_END=1826 /DNA_ORIENTATION=-